MKTKITLLIAVACMISTASFAQAKFGAKVGTNFSNLTFRGDGTEKMESKAGLNFGLFADFKVSDKFSIQPEFNISQMGAKDSYSSPFIDEEIDEILDIKTTDRIKLSYIAIPVLAKVHISNLALLAGPQLSFLTSAKNKYTIIGMGSGTQDIIGVYNGSEFSLVMGAEYGLGDKLVVGARYQAGLSDLSKETVPGSSTKSSAFTLSVGFKFN